MNTVYDRLRETLALDGQWMLGCRRRNDWSGDTTSWRAIRGNALLALVGEKKGVHTPAGYFQYFGLDVWPMAFRGGQWNQYWMDDFTDLWALVQAYDAEPSGSRTVIVLHENEGLLDIKPIAIPESIDAAQRASAIISGALAEPPDRITKSDARAHRVCRYCPVRARCNAQDILDNATRDWSESYRKELA